MAGRLHEPHPASEVDPDVWVTHVVEDAGDQQEDEQLGTKEKFWVRRAQDERPWLLKLARGEGVETRGEDWAEWLVHKLAQSLGVPSAIVIPARWEGRRGILTRSFVDVEAGQRLVHGNERLAERDPGYDSAIAGENPHYTVQGVFAALEGVAAPEPFAARFTAFDVWYGFVSMDALVAGRDRHHENWGIVRDATLAALAPTFDHGNALGFQVSDTQRARLLDDPAMLRRWLGRGRSRHFAGRPDLVEIARQARALANPDAQQHWRERIASVGPNALDSSMSSIPLDVMSEPARTFATTIVRENRRRLLDDDSA